jgi:hypothetical protein
LIPLLRMLVEDLNHNIRVEHNQSLLSNSNEPVPLTRSKG